MYWDNGKYFPPDSIWKEEAWSWMSYIDAKNLSWKQNCVWMPVREWLILFFKSPCVMFVCTCVFLPVTTFVPLFGYNVVLVLNLTHKTEQQSTEMHLFWREFDILYIVNVSYCKSFVKCFEIIFSYCMFLWKMFCGTEAICTWDDV